MPPRIEFVTAYSLMVFYNRLTAHRRLLRTRVNTNVTTKNKTPQVERAGSVGVIPDFTRKVTIATSNDYKMTNQSLVAKTVKTC